MTDAAIYPAAWRDHDSDFDPKAHMTQLKGRDYLTVQDRLRWFVRDQRALLLAGVAAMPYIVKADLVEHNPTERYANYACYVRDVLGNESTMYGSETGKDFGDYLEKASTKALGRALLALGYSTGSAQDLDEDPDRPADAPQDRRQQRPAQPQAGQQQQEQPRHLRAVPPAVNDAMDAASQVVPAEEQVKLLRSICNVTNHTKFSDVDAWLNQHVRPAAAPRGPIGAANLKDGKANITAAEASIVRERLEQQPLGSRVRP